MNDTLQAYITTTETLYPGATDFDSVIVRLYGRTRDNMDVTISVKGFEPFFLTRREERDKVAEADHEGLVRYEPVDTDPLSERFHDNPTDLVKVVTEYPHNVAELRDEFDKTWSAD